MFLFPTESLCVCLLTERPSVYPSIGAAGQGVRAVHQTAAAGPEPARYGQHCTTRKPTDRSLRAAYVSCSSPQIHAFSLTDLYRYKTLLKQICNRLHISRIPLQFQHSTNRPVTVVMHHSLSILITGCRRQHPPTHHQGVAAVSVLRSHTLTRFLGCIMGPLYSRSQLVGNESFCRKTMMLIYY